MRNSIVTVVAFGLVFGSFNESSNAQTLVRNGKEWTFTATGLGDRVEVDTIGTEPVRVRIRSKVNRPGSTVDTFLILLDRIEMLIVDLGDGNDVLAATNCPVQITAFGGNGDDTIQTGACLDDLYGGPGSDTILAGDGIDNCEGGDGNDYIDGQGGDDGIDGGSGFDVLIGGPGVDALNGQIGTDLLIGASLNPSSVASVKQIWFTTKPVGELAARMTKLRLNLPVIDDDAETDFLGGAGGTDLFLGDFDLPGGFVDIRIDFAPAVDDDNFDLQSF